MASDPASNPTAPSRRPFGDNPATALVRLGVIFAPLLGLAAAKFIDVPAFFELAAWLATFLLAWLVLLRYGDGWRSIGMKAPPNGWRLFPQVILATFILIVFSIATGIVIYALTRSTADLSKVQDQAATPTRMAIMIVVIWITAAFGEEMLFRGVLMNGLAEFFAETEHRWLWALVVSSVAFGLLHFYQGPVGVVRTALIGAVLGFYYLWNQRNLWLCILVHGLFDTFNLALLYVTSNTPH